MVTKNLFITLFFIVAGILKCYPATFATGEEKTISSPVENNLYIAAGTITIDAMIKGELIAAGGTITINDSITEDLIVAGGNVLVNGIIGDEAKIMGQNIKILKNIHGDLVVFGASIQVSKDVIIDGDLIIFGRHAHIQGTVNGNLKAYGGRIVLDGITNGEVEIKANELSFGGKIIGASKIAANTIELKNGAQFHQSVTYWNKDGEMDFGNFLVNGTANYSEELKFVEGDVNWMYFGLGMIAFWIIYLLSVAFTIMLLVLLFQKPLSKAGALVTRNYIKNFGYGAIYFIGIPLIALFLMVTIIGIPIGMVLLSIYVFSLLFAYSITSVVAAYAIKMQYAKDWNQWIVMLVSLLIFLVLRIFSAIPFIGTLAAMIVIGITYGTLISPGINWIKTSRSSTNAEVT